MPESSDADQQGIILSPSNQTRLIAEAAARQIVMEHIGLCPFAAGKIDERVRTLENSLAKLIGFMIGSGLLGGMAGAGISKIIGN